MTTNKKISAILATTMLVMSARLAAADEIKVSQANKTFAPETATAKVGDKLTFVNDDNVAHTVQVNNGDSPTNLGLMKPGESKSIDLTKPGTYDVKCLIHPKMKMTVTVN